MGLVSDLRSLGNVDDIFKKKRFTKRRKRGKHVQIRKGKKR